jgi:ArsR family transcriptional regulator
MIMSVAATQLENVTELLRVLSEPARVRLLAVLGEAELSVAELTGVTQLAQSRVSTHLGKLKEAGLVRDRRVGSASFYALNSGAMPAEAARLWQVTREAAEDVVLEQDRARAREVVEARKRGMSWADAVAGQMERHYSPGRTWEATARGLLGLCRLGDVLDVASGDGAVAELLAPRARSVTCLDQSERVIRAARARLERLPNVRFELGDMQALPFASASFDAVLLMNCLTYAEEPRRAIAEAARVVCDGGMLAGVTLRRHPHEQLVAAYGHRNRGFQPKQLGAMLKEAGFAVERCEITSREANPPHFEVITFHARKDGTEDP